MRRVFVDTSVLFPFSIMDLFLALSENGIVEVVWTDELLDEWERVIVRKHHRSQESAASVTAAIRDYAHSAAAIAARVEALITSDGTGFPADALAERGVRVTGP